MLKFFRLYNKYILVVGGAILMVAFLIQPALSIFRPQPGDQTLGTVGQWEITYGDKSTAASELYLLEQVPILSQFAGDDALRWLLMVHEARQMGLSASDAEVRQLTQAIGLNPRAKARILQQLRAGEDFIDQTLRHWLVVQKYRELLLGQVHSPVMTRLSTLATAQQFFQQGNLYGGATLIGMAYGTPRISEPLVRQFLYNQYATVSGETVLVGHRRYLDQVEPPTRDRIQALFERYRDDLPGEGEPYGLGYRVPARIKVEYLSIPLDDVLPTVNLEEAKMLDFYDQHPDRFTPQGDDQPQPYAQVRSRIMEQMRRQKADELAQQMIRTARSALLEDQATRLLPQEGGYRRIPEGFQPMPLEQAARAVEREFGVRPRVRSHTDEWVPVGDLAQLPGLGDSFPVGRRNVSAQDYIMSAREMHPALDNPLVPLRLQVGLPSAPMQSWDGAYHLFRLTAAQPARSPESLDQVRAQVERDARDLAAYQLLLADRDRWLTQAREQGLEAFAADIGAAMLNVPPTPRRTGLTDSAAGDAGPTIPGIGRAGELLAAMFDTGARIARDQPTGRTVADAPADRRTGAAGLDPRLALAVFRLDGFQPMSRSNYQAIASDPRIGSAISQYLQPAESAADEDPLSLEAIQRRVGFVAEGE